MPLRSMYDYFTRSFTYMSVILFLGLALQMQYHLQQKTPGNILPGVGMGGMR